VSIPSWLCNIVTSDAFLLVVGALLAGLIGYGFSRLQEHQKAEGVRTGLGPVLHGELVTMAPGERLVDEDPPTARYLVYSTLPQLLAPGVIDPRTNTPLLMLLIRFNYAVENFNAKAQAYNAAWASDRHPQVIALLYRDLETAFLDYERAHTELLNQVEQVGQLGGPLPLSD
jgi:hypothetical protein